MSKPLRTPRASAILEEIKTYGREALKRLDEIKFQEAADALHELSKVIQAKKQVELPHEESLLNDFFILERYNDFLTAYVVTWRRVVEGQFSESWEALQDSLDLLRLLKRLSHIDIDFFEHQLTALEKAYPYNIFVSVGMIVAGFDCNICGYEVSSSTCIHRQGELYGGIMAIGTARNIIDMDHLAMVENPEDKRCVLINFDNSSEQFNPLRHLSKAVTSDEMSIIHFDHLELETRKVLNSKYRKLSRNEPCYCGSEKKFKRCCESHQFFNEIYTKIIGSKKRLEDAIP